MDTHHSIIYMRIGTHGFYRTMSPLYARQRGQFAPWNCGRGNSFGSHGQQRGQAEGKVRLSLGARRMQMAAGLSGHRWSPLVCRRAACSGTPGNHRTTGTSAVSSGEMGSSCTQHICFFHLGGRGGESRVENNHRETVFLTRIL